jgi:hypothetical protein
MPSTYVDSGPLSTRVDELATGSFPLPRHGDSGMLVGPEELRRSSEMPTFMDVHRMEGGVSAADVAKAHQADVETQEQYGVQYQRYWVDENAGRIFCLVDAPDAETAARVHREAHGLVADEIYEVTEHS